MTKVRVYEIGRLKERKKEKTKLVERMIQRPVCWRQKVPQTCTPFTEMGTPSLLNVHIQGLVPLLTELQTPSLEGKD